MTLRSRMLAGLIAGLAVPAVAYAARAGLTRYDLEHGNVPLLSQRTATSTTTAANRPQQARARSTRTASNQDPRHDAVNPGPVRTTKG